MKRLKNLLKTKRLTNAFHIRNNASPGSVVGESFLTCHSAHQNVGLMRKRSKKWWMLLPACALPFLFSPACCLEVVKCHLGPCGAGQHPRNTEQHQRRSLMLDLYVTFHRSALLQPDAWKPVNQILFSTLIFPKFKGARFYNFISTKLERKTIICIWGHKCDFMIYFLNQLLCSLLLRLLLFQHFIHSLVHLLNKYLRH